jgi:hypothetical protein
MLARFPVKRLSAKSIEAQDEKSLFLQSAASLRKAKKRPRAPFKRKSRLTAAF